LSISVDKIGDDTPLGEEEEGKKIFYILHSSETESVPEEETV